MVKQKNVSQGAVATAAAASLAEPRVGATVTAAAAAEPVDPVSEPYTTSEAVAAAPNPLLELVERNGISHANYAAAVETYAKLQGNVFAGMQHGARHAALVSKMASGLPLAPLEVVEFGPYILAKNPRYKPLGFSDRGGPSDPTCLARAHMQRIDRGDQRNPDETPSPFGGISLDAVQAANDAALRR